MKLETFFEKFDQFADAPNAVAKMRELVLELAVQGKLVDQNPAEGDGHTLLNQIHKKNPPPDTDAEAVTVDSELPNRPESWALSKLGEVAEIIRGVSFPGSAKSETPSDGDVACLRTASVQAEIDWDDLIFISPAHVSRTEQWVATNDIMISMANSYALVGKVAIVRQVPQKATFGAFLAAIRPILIEPYFLLYVLRSPRMQAAFRASSSQTTNIANISLGRMRPLPFPLPPLAEQKRIVAKVDELMGLCDRLEVQQQERQMRHAALARASLARFADAPNPANLSFIFHPSYTITPADLRKSILTLAVQGKLVPQDPNDEPVEDSMARLERDRSRLAKEQGVRSPKNVPPLTAEDYPYDIPESWQWSRIGHLALVIDYGTSQKADSDSSKIPVYRMGNIVGGRLVDENLKYVNANINDLPRLYLKTDDILFNRTNSYELVGKAGIFTGRDDTTTFASYLIRIRLPSTLLFPTFYSVAMNAPYFRQTQIEPEVVQQCGQANFNGTKLASTVVPVPPLAEQRRIVAKVDQLMALVDQLETQLAASRATATNLLEALVAELTVKE